MRHGWDRWRSCWGRRRGRAAGGRVEERGGAGRGGGVWGGGAAGRGAGASSGTPTISARTASVGAARGFGAGEKRPASESGPYKVEEKAPASESSRYKSEERVAARPEMIAVGASAAAVAPALEKKEK